MSARRSTVLGLAIFSCVVCAWLAAASPAGAKITSLTPSQPSFTEHVSFNGTLATFTTDNPFDTFSQSISWGDGTMDTGPASVNGDNGTVSGSHTYNEDGTYTMQVILTESGASSDTRTITFAVTVADGDATVAAVAPITVAEGKQFSGPVASFTDPGSPDTASNFTATINWGDGTTTAGIVAGASGNFMVGGSHTYTDELANAVISVTVSETDAGTRVGPSQDHLSVTEADSLTAHPTTFAANDGTPFSGTVATFSDASAASASDFTATIHWGDGTTTSGTVTGSGGTLAVSGTHTYNSPPSNYPVQVTLAEDSPGTATANAASSAAVAVGRPSAATQRATGLKISGATLNGTVDPNGGGTTYFFQFGTTTVYGSSTRVAIAGAGNAGLAVSASVSKLRPGTTYHYRIVATNPAGATVGADQTLTTPALVLGVKARRDGSFLVIVNAPSAGTVDVTVLAGGKAFGHGHARAKHAGRLQLVVHANRHNHRRITLRLTITFTPRGGGATSVTFPGPHLPR